MLAADFLSRLGDERRQQLLALGEQRRFARNHLVFRVGEQDPLIYILLEGRVKIFQSSNARESILWFCAPGEVFGLAEAIRGGAREVAARTTSDALIAAVPAQAFVHFVLSNEDIGRSVLETLAARVQALRTVVMEASASDAASRVTKVLCRLARAHGQPSSCGTLVDLAITHKEISQMSGSSRQTVTSVISDLRRRGLVRLEARRLCVVDLETLEALDGNFADDEEVAAAPPGRTADRS
ncbi:MAG TPA: Crp/Fnr family transcriptional regulator [Acidiferrobacteraceae bacterium]|nr:Crp/Fnr family transcriptional regulator [Acidiferrobacteraceae bacterium]